MRLDYARLAKVEGYAAEVLEGMRIRKVPVDPCDIAIQEGIELAPSHYGDGFFGRIEYHSGEGGFILFYPELEGCRFPQVIRFSIGHELAHYYIPEHAGLLRAGRFHNSTPGFVCENVLEREADHFAGALLIPERVLKERCGRRGWMDMKEILKLAEDCVTSATSAAIRYAKFAEESCVAILSRTSTREVICAIPSQEAQARGLWWVERVPAGTVTAKISAPIILPQVLSGATTSEIWFPSRTSLCELWEEAFPLGATDLTLTLLSPNK
jgi:hypothetical protein